MGSILITAWRRRYVTPNAGILCCCGTWRSCFPRGCPIKISKCQYWWSVSSQETAKPFSEQLSNMKMNRNLDLFRTTCKVLRIPKDIERIWSRQRLLPWFRAVMTSWMYERAKRHMSRNTEAYQSFPRAIGPGAKKRTFFTHRNAFNTAVKRVAGAPCVTDTGKREVLRADLDRNVSLCLHNSFCRNREQKVNVDLLPCGKPRLLEQESGGHPATPWTNWRKS